MRRGADFEGPGVRLAIPPGTRAAGWTLTRATTLALTSASWLVASGSTRALTDDMPYNCLCPSHDGLLDRLSCGGTGR